MKFSFELKTNLTPQEIWPLYADTEKWYQWEEQLKSISLDGDFATGTKGEMTLGDQPPMRFLLTSVKENEHFTDETTIPGMGKIAFHHQLEQENDQTIIRHSVEFTAENGEEKKETAPFIAKVFQDVPAAVFALVEAAK